MQQCKQVMEDNAAMTEALKALNNEKNELTIQLRSSEQELEKQ